MYRSLVEQAQGGDAAAFDALVRETGDRSLSIAFRVIRDLHLAEDAVQAAYVEAWRDLPALRDPEQFEAWFHRLLVRACYREARHSRRHEAVVRAVPAGGDGGFDETGRVVDRDQLERCMRRLPIEHRTVLVFHHYLDLPVAEIATRLGIPVGTVKSRLHYATTSMRAALEADARPPTITEIRSA